MVVSLSSYKLSDVWTPIRKDIATEIKNSYLSATGITLLDTDATNIEQFLYDYSHVLLNCRMLFSDEAKLSELQSMLKAVVRHKAYALVTEWKAIKSYLNVDSGKSIHQESFYDVADTPRIETKDWNELDIVNKQMNAMYTNTQAVREFYREVKELVQTIY